MLNVKLLKSVHNRVFCGTKHKWPVVSKFLIRDVRVVPVYSWIRLNYRTVSSTSFKRNQAKENASKSNDDLKSEYTSEGKLSGSKFGQFAGIAIIAGTIFAIYYWSTSKSKSVAKISEKDTFRNEKNAKYPAQSTDIPSKIPYLLIGGGTASFSAFRAIKSNDPFAKVLIVSEELYYPYMRPPLSKEMWFAEDTVAANTELHFKQWNGTERSLFYEPADFYLPCEKLEKEGKGGVSIIRGWKVVRVNPLKRVAILEDGKEIQYDKCLIATGLRPKTLDILEKEEFKDKVGKFRKVDDYFHLRRATLGKKKDIVIIGGGFLGSELACALAKRDFLNIIQVFPENGVMSKVFPHYLSKWTTARMIEQNVHMVPNAKVEDASLSSDKQKVVLKLSNGDELQADYVVVAIGSEPNVDLAVSSGLEVDSEKNGFVVNSEFAVNSNLYVAGDCASFYDPQLGRRRVEHHDHSVVSGRLAGENMVGAGKPFLHQSMFWSDLGAEIGYEAIGIVDSRLPTVGIFVKSNETNNSEETTTVDESLKEMKSFSQHEENYGRGIIFYLRDGIIVGIVLWNIFSRMPIARQVLKEKKKYDDMNEVAKLFNIHA